MLTINEAFDQGIIDYRTWNRLTIYAKNIGLKSSDHLTATSIKYFVYLAKENHIPCAGKKTIENAEHLFEVMNNEMYEIG